MSVQHADPGGIDRRHRNHFSGCVSRSGVGRTSHSLDKDGRCVFCDDTPRSSRLKAAAARRAMEQSAGYKRAGVVQRRIERAQQEKLEQLVDDLDALEDVGA